MSSGWKTLESRLIYKNPWIKLPEQNTLHSNTLISINGTTNVILKGEQPLRLRQSLVLTGTHF